MKVLIYSLSIIIILTLFLLSVSTIEYVDHSQYKSVLPLILIGNFVKALPANTVVYTTLSVPLSIYVNYQYNILVTYPLQNCSWLGSGDLLVARPNMTVERTCNLTVLYRPTTPRWLNNYTLFDDNPDDNFYNYTLYRKS